MAMPKLELPATFSLKVYTTDGKNVVEATVEFRPGQYPTDNDVQSALARVRAELKEQLSTDARLATPEEMWKLIVRDVMGAGVSIATPAQKDWAPPRSNGDAGDLKEQEDDPDEYDECDN